MSSSRPIRCPNCRKWFRAEEDLTLVLCPHCSTPIHLLHAPDASPSKPLPVPQRIASLLQQAWQNRRVGNLTYAEEDFAGALLFNPRCAEAWAGRGLVLALLEEEKLHAFYGEALNCLEKAKECDQHPRTELLVAYALYEICRGLHAKLYRRFRGKTWDWSRWVALLDPDSFIKNNLWTAYRCARKWMQEPAVEGYFPTELPTGEPMRNSQERALALALDCARLHVEICRHYLIGGVGFNPTGLGFTLARLKEHDAKECQLEMMESVHFLQSTLPEYKLQPIHTAFAGLVWFHLGYWAFAGPLVLYFAWFRPQLMWTALFRLILGYLFAWIPFIAFCYRPTERSGPARDGETPEV